MSLCTHTVVAFLPQDPSGVDETGSLCCAALHWLVAACWADTHHPTLSLPAQPDCCMGLGTALLQDLCVLVTATSAQASLAYSVHDVCYSVCLPMQVLWVCSVPMSVHTVH